MTAKRLRNIAVYYCQRYVTSKTKLRDYLNARIFREIACPEDRERMSGEIPAIVEALVGAGLVDDREAASAKLRTALRAGYARDAAIGVAARSARVDAETVTGELAGAAEEALPDLDLRNLDDRETGAVLATAALRRARRGPFRRDGKETAMQRRDIAWLQRRGFQFDDIRKAMRLDDNDD